MDIVVKKPKTGAKKSKGHKGKRQSHNKDTHKYEKQRARTSENKAVRIKKAKLRGDKAAGTSLTQADYKHKKPKQSAIDKHLEKSDVPQY